MSKINRNMFNREHAEQVLDAVQRDDYTGICINCWEEQSGCEPDALEYTCESCGENTVYGAEQLLLYIS